MLQDALRKKLLIISGVEERNKKAGKQNFNSIVSNYNKKNNYVNSLSKGNPNGLKDSHNGFIHNSKFILILVHSFCIILKKNEDDKYEIENNIN